MKEICVKCGNPINPARYALGYHTCIECGSPKIVVPIIPGHKAAYQPVFDLDLLKCTNKYRKD